MIGRAALLAFALAAAPLRAQDPAFFVEWDFAEDEVAWQGERELAVLRFGVEQEFLQQNVVEMFRRPLDLQLRLNSQAWDVFEAADLRPVSGNEGKSFAWNGEVVRASESKVQRDGNTWLIFELPVQLSWREVPAQAHDLPSVVLEFDFATEFEEDFLGDRTPLNQRRAEIASFPLKRELRELPRPLNELTFGPAELIAHASSPAIEVGAEYSVVLETVPVEGARLYGGQVRWLPNGLETAWAVVGEIDLEAEAGTQRRRFDFVAREPGEYRLEFLREVFDPRSGQVNVLPATVAVKVSSGSALPVEPPSIATVDFGEKDGPRPWLLLPLVLLGAGLIWIYARSMHQQRLRVAAWESGAMLAESDVASRSASGEPLQHWLADQLGWSPSRLVSPQAEASLQEQGASATLAKETSHFLAACEAARYGGPAVADAAAQRDHLRRAWEQHLRAPR